ncbi:MAG: radical SAM protein [Candidatus Falkowbacteria bacterium]|nr:MAG: radical SAM protein [Candidatus Falkowbacteria bacterium]
MNLKKHGNLILKLSLFGHFLEKDEVICGYNALKIETVYFAKELLPHLMASTERSINDVLTSVPEKDKKQFITTLSRLMNSAILVPNNYNETEYLKSVQQCFPNKPNVRVMVMHMTDYCNLNCRYCFIEGAIKPDYQRRIMNTETAQATIDKFAEIIGNKKFPKKPSIVFYGGEPLENFSTIKFSLEYLAKKTKSGTIQKVDNVIITNGTLITDEIALVLKKYKVLVAVSLDGPEEIHDYNRVFHSGKGSFAKTMNGINCLQRHGIKPSVACVLSKNSLPHMEEILHFILGDLKIDSLGFNHVSIIPNFNEYDPEYEEQCAAAIVRSQEIIQEYYPNVYERRMNNKMYNFFNRQLLHSDCTGCGEQMSVSTDGQIGICQGYMGSRKTFNNTVFNADANPNNDPVFQEWSTRSPLNMPECYNCIALSTCGGGCPRNADFLSGSIWNKDEAFCFFAKKAQTWMIWKKYQNLNQ